jgi:hypothetical protein
MAAVLAILHARDPRHRADHRCDHAGDRATAIAALAFSLTPSTRREGVIVVGASVSVRYREDGKNHVATAIALQRTKE